MPRKAVAHKGKYAVAKAQVRLTVLVGDRQYGSSMVFLDGEPIANGDVDELPIGRGEDVIGKELLVYTVVTDVRDRKNDISVTWILTGGERPLTVEKEGSASKGFGSQMFRAEFKLVEPK
jgi:hypothetical protein